MVAARRLSKKKRRLCNEKGVEKVVSSGRGQATLQDMKALRDGMRRTARWRAGWMLTAWFGLATMGSAERVFLFIRGADGEAAYGERFSAQIQAWQEALAGSGARCEVIGGSASETASPNEAVRLRERLAALPKEGPDELWLVFIGHGTWDGVEARFNLRGPDVSASEVAEWLEPFQRPLVVINTSSCSGPFLAKLSKPGRIIVTATRGGNEKNYARFGDELAVALKDPAADADQDGQISVLELAVRATHRTVAFYREAGRLATEHALIDDNGDALGTPLEWFRGLRATKKGKGETDGFLARQRVLVASPGAAALTEAQRQESAKIEEKIAALRERKTELPEEDYFNQLEALLLELATAKGIE